MNTIMTVYRERVEDSPPLRELFTWLDSIEG